MELKNLVNDPPPTLSGGSLSQALYGIDWNKLLPQKIGNYELRKGSVESLFQFSIQNSEDAHDENSFVPGFKPFTEEISEKLKYYQLCSDVFDFYLGDELVGVAVSNPSDWCSYYLRYILIKKEHQGHNLQNQWVRFVIASVEPHGIERIEVDFSPANTVQLFHYQRMGFYYVGMTMSERWGAVMRYVRYLNPNRRDAYLDQFFHGTKSRG